MHILVPNQIQLNHLVEMQLLLLKGHELVALMHESLCLGDLLNW